MAKTTTPAFTQNIIHTITTFTDADSTNLKTIATAGTNDSRITHITISSNDTANTAFFYIDDGADNANISNVDIPENSGTNGTTDIVIALSATTFLHRQLDNNANPFFQLGANNTLKMRLSTAVSATKEIKVIVTQEDY